MLKTNKLLIKKKQPVALLIVLIFALVLIPFVSYASEPETNNTVAFGYVYNNVTATQTVPSGLDVTFNTNGALQNVSHTAGEKEITVNVAGNYNINFSVNTSNTTNNNPNVWGIAVNGTVVQNFSAAGSNIVGGTELALNAGDIITLRNVASVPDPVNLNAGVNSCWIQIDKVNSAGGYVYDNAASSGTTGQTVPLYSDATFNSNGPLQGITHIPGTGDIKVSDAGNYNINFSVNTANNNPQQWGIAVNGIIKQNFSAYGQNLHADAVLKLDAGDVVTIRNTSTSYPANLRANVNAIWVQIDKIDNDGGYVYNLSNGSDAVQVPSNSNLNYNINGYLQKITYNGGTGGITVGADGIYSIQFAVYTNNNNGWGIAVNGAVVQKFSASAKTTDATYVLELKAGDVVTVRNIGSASTLRNGIGITSAWVQIDRLDITIPVTGIIISGNTSVIAGNQTGLTATVFPTNATNKNVTWTSSDTTIATVDDSGKVTTLKAGLIIITATSVSDKSITATYPITVTAPDTTPPVITISNYNTAPTNQDITVTASTNEGTLNATRYKFTENGEFTFTATDTAGNTTSKTVTIDNIDKTAPVIKINDYNKNPTKDDITVTASTNEGTLNTTIYKFTENGEFTFTATDTAGNTTSKTVTITNIDKIAPIITIGSYTTAMTNQDITVTASTNEGTLNATSHTFTENASFIFTATDAAGNTSSKTVTIDNIDKTFPVITIGNYSIEPTNQDITVTASTNEGTLNLNSYIFKENGSFTFTATDVAGNTIEVKVTITNIDKTFPVITIGDYSTAPTNQNITVTASTSEGTLNATSHTFTENGEFTFKATDAAGNTSEVKVTITNVDKTAPIITIGNYSTEPTNQDITVTASTNEGTLNAISHTFTENGEFTFKATDVAGNTIEVKVTITNIDKTFPVITIGNYSTAPTNQNITVTASTNEGTLNSTSYKFTENGSFTFTATDAAGNKSEVKVTITSIDKIAPIITIGNYSTAPTKDDITVTASTNEGTLNAPSYTFTENGSFTFTAADTAGNIAFKTVTITNIDKTFPVITIGSYTTAMTNQDITVTASTNEGTLNAPSYTFTENGSFTFTATDKAGNTTSKTVTITNIDKTAPVITIGSYTKDMTNQDITVTASTNEGTLNLNSYIFKENGSFTFTATDAAGNIAFKTVTITNIDKTAPIITIGDYSTAPTNQDITVTALTNEGTLNATSHTFTENGEFTFKATDAAGNTTPKTVTITYIDKIAPIITIGSCTTAMTNQDITVTASTNEGTLNAISHTFTENGEFTFKATDAAGNTTSKTVTITNIDKIAPIITIGNYSTAPTNQNITVIASTDEGKLNADSHIFTENGSFTFTAKDVAGNTSSKTVTITNINKISQTTTATTTAATQIADSPVALTGTVTNTTTTAEKNSKSTTESTTSSTTQPSTPETTESTTIIDTTAAAKSASDDTETTVGKSNSSVIIISTASALIGSGLIILIIKRFKP